MIAALLAMLSPASAAADVAYHKPLSVPPPAVVGVARVDAETAFERLSRLLEAAPMRLVRENASDRRLMVRFHGDTEVFLDCGAFVRPFVIINGGIEATAEPAARNRLLVHDDRRTAPVQRRLELEVQTLFELEPAGDVTVVRATSSFVVVRRMRPLASDGGDIDVDVASFASGERTLLTDAVICQSSGRLERWLQHLTSARLEAEP